MPSRHGRVEAAMDIRALTYFRSVAELGSFSKAARTLRVAQPAISRQVQKLEDELGLPLMIRSGGGIELTEAGALLFERARLMLQQMEQTRHDVMAQSASPSGVVAVGVPAAAGAFIMPGVLETARQQFPRITLKVIEGIGRPLHERLVDRRLTVGLIYDPLPHNELVCSALVIERIHLFGAMDSICARSRAFTVEDLDDLPLILPTRPHNVRVLLEDAAAELGFRLRVVYEVDSLAVLRALVRQGAGYGVLTAGSVLDDMHHSQLVSRPIETAGMSLTLSIVSRMEHQRSRSVVEIVRCIRSVTRSLIEQRQWPGSPIYVPGDEGVTDKLASWRSPRDAKAE